jgi:hypothetical protein
MKQILIAIFVGFLGFGVQAQESTETQEGLTFKKSDHQLGLHAGSTTGLGFSYRYWPKKWGVQITGIPIFQQGSSYASVGLSALHTFNENKVVDFYGYFGNHMIINNNSYSYVDGNGNIVEQKNSDIIYNAGLGFGLKFKFLEVLYFNIQTGYSVIDITDQPFSMIAGEIGFYYHL